MMFTPLRSHAAAARSLPCALRVAALAALLLSASSSATAQEPTPEATPEATPAAPAAASSSPQQPEQTAINMTIRWKGRAGVERYRLQVARDRRFQDIVFDQAVVGREAQVPLEPGRYFWRVATARGETGAFTRAEAFEAKVGGDTVTGDAPVDIAANPTPTPVTTPTPDASPTATPSATPTPRQSPAGVGNVIVASGRGGWRTATGEMARPVLAQLRAGRPPDLVGTSSDGTTYALDSERGVALWLTPFNPGAKRSESSASPNPVAFTPLVVPVGENESYIFVTWTAGIRALKGATGGEAWRVTLDAGSATTGVAADMDGDGKAEVVVLAGSPSTLYVLNAQTGRMVSQTKLEANVVGAPVAFASGEVRGVALGLDNDTIDIRIVNGESLRSRKLEAKITTAPLLVESSRGQLVTIGTEKGLDALDVKELTPLGRIVTENDTVHATLSAADLDRDGSVEVVMLTRRGRVAVVSTQDGKIRWFADGAAEASSTSFADLDGDGALDVLVPAGNMFALGFSGRDGTLIWKVEDGRAGTTDGGGRAMRGLAIVPLAGDDGFVVGGEPSRIGLRAVELPRGAAKTAATAAR